MDSRTAFCAAMMSWSLLKATPCDALKRELPDTRFPLKLPIVCTALATSLARALKRSANADASANVARPKSGVCASPSANGISSSKPPKRVGSAFAIRTKSEREMKPIPRTSIRENASSNSRVPHIVAVSSGAFETDICEDIPSEPSLS